MEQDWERQWLKDEDIVWFAWFEQRQAQSLLDSGQESARR